MHVAVFGAGALGSLYGVRLAARAGVTVTFVVRPSKAADAAPIAIERVKDDARESIDAPVRTAEVRGDADVVLLCVGTEDLDAIRAPIDAAGPSDAPIVVLTPMLPKDWARMREAFGDRVHAGMPSAVAYANERGVVRYWLPPAPTRIDEPRSGTGGEAVRALARALDAAGLPAHLELGVHETNPATTVCAIGVGMSLAIAGSFDALADDAALADLASRACREGVAIARTIGRPLAGATLAPWLAGRWSLRAARALLHRFSPEALFYAEEHFGRKLRAQHLQMAREIAALARARGLGHAAFDELAATLESVGAMGAMGAVGR